MRFRAFAVLAFAVLAFALPLLAQPAQPAPETSAVLRMQTQELLDAVTHGSAAVWSRYLDERAVVTAEDGSVSTKAQMVEGIKPLPEGVSGDIRIVEFNAVDHGAVAVTMHVDDEHETYHGQRLHCQYRSTDTWMKTPQGWRLIASQVLALRTDPPALAQTPAQSAGYTGRYTLAPGITYEIRQRDGKLEGQRNGRAAEPLLAEAPDVFFVAGSPRYRKIFQRDAAGKITGFVERREAWDLTWTRVP
jgi:ketosteroid isomerase-like protein